jgi:hypothetical protein
MVLLCYGFGSRRVCQSLDRTKNIQELLKDY